MLPDNIFVHIIFHIQKKWSPQYEWVLCKGFVGYIPHKT